MDRSDLEQWKPKEVARLLALVEAERRYYQEIVAGLPVGLLVLSSDLSVLSSNFAVRRIFRLRSGDPLRGRLDALFPQDVLDKVQIVLASGVAQGGIVATARPEHGGATMRISIQPIRSWDYTEEPEALLTIEEVSAVAPPAETAAPSPEPEPAPVAEPEPSAEESAVEAPVEAPSPAENIPELSAVELLQGLDAIVWAASLPTFGLLFVNATGKQLLGWSAENPPAAWLDRVHPEDREHVAREYAATVEEGLPVTVEFRALKAGGGFVWLRETVRPLTDEGGIARHAVGFAIDITQRCREEEARLQAARADALMRLCSRLAHDMNNQLMIVSGYGEEILNTLDQPDQLRASVDEVRRAGERLSAISEQLLEFTRRKAEEAVSLDASAVVREVAAALAGTLPESTVLKASADEAVYVMAAHEQLSQSLHAFLEHAVHAMHQGGEILVATTCADGMGVIAIHHSGFEGGADVWQGLFEGILPPKDSPAGLVHGISRAWTWVQQWGGVIDVEASPEAGTTVAIRLPAGEAPPAPVEEVPPVSEEEEVVTEEPPAPEPEPETILVVEDETGIRALVRKILERQGYRVLDAPQADVAIRLCQEFAGTIHLVITDVVMPEMGGREMVEKLLEIRPGIRVVYVSGYTDDPQVRAADISQGSVFLQKPFTLGALLDKVREVLEA